MSQPELVAVRMPPGAAFLDALDKVWNGGGAVLPLPWHAKDREVRRIIDALQPNSLVQPRQGSAGAPAISRLQGGRPASNGTALVVATSGTTGTPKGVELTHAALNASTQASLSRLEAKKGDRWLVCLPLHHVAGLGAVLRSRRLDADPIVHERFSVEAVAGETRASFVSVVPTMLHRLLEAGVDLSTYKAVLVGGAAVSATLMARAVEAGVEVVTTYGMSETAGGCVYDGVPLHGVDVDLDDAGRIFIRGPMLMRGYRLRPDLTARAFRDGWFVTNDLGRFGDDGRLEVLGRLDDVIITGGENVMASVVANVLAGDERVREVAVVGRDDPEWGQLVTAVVVPTDPDDPPTLEDLRTTASDHLPSYAWPKAVWHVERLPRDAMGKISRPALQALVNR